MTLRVNSGFCRGMNLRSPKGDQVRPTSARVREAVMNMLQSSFDDALVLDLFAGSGAVGIEAASRGAKGVVFVERDRDTLTVLNHNIDELKKRCVSNSVEVKPLKVMSSDANRVWRSIRGYSPFDIVWADPPYDIVRDFVEVLKTKAFEIASDESIMAIESHIDDLGFIEEAFTEDENWRMWKQKTYGRTAISIFKKI